MARPLKFTDDPLVVRKSYATTTAQAAALAEFAAVEGVPEADIVRLAVTAYIEANR